MQELDTPPTLEELSKAIDSLACGKALGKDGIPPKVLKQGKQTILQPLHKLLCLCWDQGFIPQDIRNANIVTLCNRDLKQTLEEARWTSIGSKVSCPRAN